jgi:hypothetical protein
MGGAPGPGGIRKDRIGVCARVGHRVTRWPVPPRQKPRRGCRRSSFGWSRPLSTRHPTSDAKRQRSGGRYARVVEISTRASRRIRDRAPRRHRRPVAAAGLGLIRAAGSGWWYRVSCGPRRSAGAVASRASGRWHQGDAAPASTYRVPALCSTRSRFNTAGRSTLEAAKEAAKPAYVGGQPRTSGAGQPRPEAPRPAARC